MTTRNWWMILALLLAGVGLRFMLLGAQELRGDEAFSWNYVANEPGPAALVARIIREGDPQPPLHYWVLQGWVRLFGESEWALRSQSALLSVVLLPLMYQLGRRVLKGQRGGVVALGLTALHPFQIWLAQDARSMYPLALGGVLVATLLLPGLLKGRRSAWVGYVVAATFAMYSHYYALFGLVAHGAFVLVQQVGWQAIRRWVAAGVMVALLVLPWAVVILPVYAGGQLADPTVLPLGRYLWQTLSAAALGVTVDVGLGWVGLVLLLVLGGLGVSRLRGQQAWLALLLAWVGLALVGIYAVTFTRATFNAFYFSMAYPAVGVLLTAGLLQLSGWQRQIGVSAGLVAVVLAGLALNNLYFNPEFSKTRGLREVAALLQREGQAGDLFVANFPDPATVYYLRNVTLPYVLLPGNPNDDPATVQAAVQALASDSLRVWHLPVRAVSWDADRRVEQALAANFFSAADYQFRQVRLRLFVPEAANLPGFMNVEANFEDGLQLVGAYATLNGQPLTAAANPQAGDWLRVSLVWQVNAPPQFDYTVFVHGVTASQGIVGQHDFPPNGQATSQLAVGTQLLDVHEFQLAATPEGALQLQVGLYDPNQIGRLPLVNGGDAVRVWPP